jgi:hypothetical protein
LKSKGKKRSLKLQKKVKKQKQIQNLKKPENKGREVSLRLEDEDQIKPAVWEYSKCCS